MQWENALGLALAPIILGIMEATRRRKKDPETTYTRVTPEPQPGQQKPPLELEPPQ